MRLALALAMAAAVAAYGAGRLLARAALRSDPSDERALVRLHRGVIALAVALLVTSLLAWSLLREPGDPGLGPLLVGLVAALGAVPLALGLAVSPAEARLRGLAAAPGRSLRFLLVALITAALWTGVPLYLPIAWLLGHRGDATTALFAAPLAYGAAALAGIALAPVLGLRLLGGAPGPGRTLPCRVFDDLGQGFARALLAWPWLRPSVLVSRSAIDRLAPDALATLLAIEEARQRLGFPRRRLALRLIVAVLGSIAAISAWAWLRGPLPFEAYFLVPALLDAWTLVLSGALRAREDRAADAAAAVERGVPAVREALLAAAALESGAASASPAVRRRLAALESPSAPVASSPVALAIAGLASLVIALSLVRLAFAPSALELGVDAFVAEDFVAAERHFRAAARAEPRNPAAAIQLAWTLVELGRADEAREWGDRAVALAPGDHDISDERSRIEEFLGLREMTAPAPP